MNIYDSYISTRLQEFLNRDEKDRKKTSFWASEAETMDFDLYHKWKGTPVTNLMEPEKQTLFLAAKMMEVALVGTLQEMGIAQKGEQQHFLVDRGVPVSGYIDAIFVDGTPLEIKTGYGYYQVQDLKAGKPKLSYLKQLAIYIDALDQKRGKLIWLERGTGEMFEFILERTGRTTYKCMYQEFDLQETYDRWKNLYENHVLKDIEPAAPRYKIPPLELDLRKYSRTDIQKALKGHKVLGDHPWAVQYSPYKDLILERQHATPGYTDKELHQLKSLI